MYIVGLHVVDSIDANMLVAVIKDVSFITELQFVVDFYGSDFDTTLLETASDLGNQSQWRRCITD